MKTFKYLVAAVVAAFVMTGCSEEQTAFDVDNVPGRSIIKGHVEYTTGTTVVNGKFAYNYVPAANLDLQIIVNNSDYGTGLNGQSVFETTTDAAGNYSIEIPAPLTKSSNVSIQSSAFEAECNTIKVINNEIKTVTETKVFSVNNTTGLTFVDGGICIKNLVCNGVSHTDVMQGYSNYTTLKGKIGRNAEFYIAPEKEYETKTFYDEENNPTETEVFVGWKSAQILPCYVPAPNADLVLTVTDGSHQTVYNVTTDAEGEFTLDVLVKEFPANYSYSIQVLPQQNATFVHYEAEEIEYADPTWTAPEVAEGEEKPEAPILTYTDYKATTITGWYAFNSSANGVSGSFSAPVQAYIAEFECKALLFDTQDEETSYNKYFWGSNDEWKSEIEERLAEEAAEKAEQANK
ncbi:MAG: carboxypeptidase-like regulatory domain-containing protein [Bacteroides sp.]|nr:carboxypeptidase-like regulatory domain-containing protein [Bacteroides sp.]MCM1378827.1 carboxypeptidase-like regulatory domain-containing protein [Bacteroides sp.]MCM1445444.1 carboxypeptidase-like regulatory domain-containing protein [Prevotella sp.]